MIYKIWYFSNQKLPNDLRPSYNALMSKWVTQINVRLDKDTNFDLKKESVIAGTTRSQIAREAIRRELARRKRARKLERDLEIIGV